MTGTADGERTRREAGAATGADGHGEPAPVRRGGWRDRIRSRPGLARVWRVAVFVAGLACIAVGFALAVLPGPLTIPPVLLGLWLWSTEFTWARRFFDAFEHKAKEAWHHARVHPVSSTIITVGGLGAAAAAFWAVSHYHLIDRARTAVGL